jgi:hypothetical protein
MTTQVSSEVSAVIDGPTADRQVASTDVFEERRNRCKFSNHED